MILWKDPHRVHADFLHDLFSIIASATQFVSAKLLRVKSSHSTFFSAPHMQHVQIKPADPADAHRQMRLVGDVVVFLPASPFAKALLRLIRTGQSVPADLDFPTLESTKINPR